MSGCEAERIGSAPMSSDRAYPLVWSQAGDVPMAVYPVLLRNHCAVLAQVAAGERRLGDPLVFAMSLNALATEWDKHVSLIESLVEAFVDQPPQGSNNQPGLES